MAMVHRIGAGTPSQVAFQNRLEKLSSTIGTGSVPVTVSARPEKTLSMPRVTRKDGIFTRVTRTPFTAPIMAPMASTSTGTKRVGTPRSSSRAATMPDQLATEPTDRSISAQTITKVMPTAMMVTSAVMRRIASAVPSVAKLGAKTMKKIVTRPKIR